MEGKDIGKVICVAHDKKKVRDNWIPCLVVTPTLQSSVRDNVAEDYLVRSFKDGKYYAVPKKDITEFTKEIGARVENPTLKTAVEKALLFIDKDELPPHWDRNLLFGVDKICIPTNNEAFNSDTSDKESVEEKDHFVAQLFKFMDDRGTPLNEAPVINEKDVDLYKLFKVVNNYGGCNKVNTAELWKCVANKAGYEQKSYLSVKNCYTQYLHSFEDFYKKLGSTMWSHPRGVRLNSKFSRSIIRDVDKAFPSTSSATNKNNRSRNELKDKKNKNFAVTDKKAKSLKTEEKLPKNNEEISKKGDKKKDDIAQSLSLNKQSVKCDPEITDLKDPVRDSKTKKEIKEILKEEIDSDAVDDNQIIEDKKVENKIYTRNVCGKSVLKTNVKKRRLIKEQIETYFEDMSFNTGISYSNIENVPFDEDSPVVMGDTVVVNYGLDKTTTYDAKVIDVYINEGVMKYYVHYKGWNSRYDEWIDDVRIAYKKKETEPEKDVDTGSSKSSFPEQNNLVTKKVPRITNRIRRSVTPLTSNSKAKQFRFSSTRPTRTCTLTDRPLFNDDICSVQIEQKTVRNDLEHISRSNNIGTNLNDNTGPIQIEVTTDYAYKFQKYESDNFYLIPSVSGEKFCRPNRHYSPKLFNWKKPDELPRIIDSPSQEEVAEQIGSIVPSVPNKNRIYLFDNNVEVKVNENLNITNKIENPIMSNQSDNEYSESQDLMISDVTVDMQNIIEIGPHFQDEVNVPDLKYEVLDLCMNPPKSPHTNIFSISEHNKLNNMIVEKDNDDESKFVVAENVKTKSDYNGQIDRHRRAQSLPPLPSSIQSNIKLKCKS